MRTEKELSQETLAAEIGISTNHLQLLESGLSDRQKQYLPTLGSAPCLRSVRRSKCRSLIC